MKVVWTRRALRHLRSAYDYWARESSPAAADTMLKRIFSAVELLERYPGAGRRGRIPGTRELVLVPSPFLIAYRTRRGTIEILALLHGARKWPEAF
jgi:addiction module RelE/StbE family toxin